MSIHLHLTFLWVVCIIQNRWLRMELFREKVKSKLYLLISLFVTRNWTEWSVIIPSHSVIVSILVAALGPNYMLRVVQWLPWGLEQDASCKFFIGTQFWSTKGAQFGLGPWCKMRGFSLPQCTIFPTQNSSEGLCTSVGPAYTCIQCMHRPPNVANSVPMAILDQRNSWSLSSPHCNPSIVALQNWIP